MVVADCESELFRDCSRGLEGGSFFLATILNRKEAKSQKGKDAIDPLKDYILIKADARFCHYFINKFQLDPSCDNTPDNLKSATSDQKELFLHKMVEEALRDLLPYFEKSKSEDPDLEDHPLQDGRRVRRVGEKNVPDKKSLLEVPRLIDEELLTCTVKQVLLPDNDHDVIDNYIEKVSVSLSATRSVVVFACKLCSFQCKYRTLCITHVESCLIKMNQPGDPQIFSNNETEEPIATEADNEVTGAKEDEKEDKFWNYKNCEFFLDALFGVTATFEKQGDGLGCFIINKLLLPIFHGLRHSNYSTSIHRFITRILCEATPKEGLQLIHERFSNRRGHPGENINRDRRMEYRIGITKKLLGNLGPNFSPEAVQHVNNTVDIKEELFYETRKSHGVDIRKLFNFPIFKQVWMLKSTRRLVQTVGMLSGHSYTF